MSTGPRGPRGKTSRLPLVGYALLVVFLAFSLYRVETVGNDNRKGLCVVRELAESRAIQNEMLLEDTPPGGFRFGIKFTPEVIAQVERNIERDRNVVDGLEFLHCA